MRNSIYVYLTHNKAVLVFVIILIFILASVIFYVIYQMEAKKVKKTSERYAYLLYLPQKLSADVLDNKYEYVKTMKSKAQLDRINVDKQMMDLVANDIPPIILVQKAINNQLKIPEFQQLLQTAPSFRFPEKGFYHYVEKRLSSQLEQRAKPVVPTFVVSFRYTSPKGRNHYRYSHVVLPETVLEYKTRIEDAQKYKRSAQYQRRMMSDSLRYDVMKRDGFRCVLCGATAQDGVKLHVDHIIPVSKGGKTTMSNLRTLCEQCNMGKRNKYDPYGKN